MSHASSAPILLSFDTVLQRPDDEGDFARMPNAQLKDAIAGGELVVSVNGAESCVHDQYPPDSSIKGCPASRRYSFMFPAGSRQIDADGTMLVGEEELIAAEYYTFGVNSMGVGVLRMSGQGAAPTVDLLEQGAASTSFNYVQSNAIFITMTCFNPKVVQQGHIGDPEPIIALMPTGGAVEQVLSVRRDPNSKALADRIQAAINMASENMKEAQTMRTNEMVHKLSPGLSKPFMYAGAYDLDTLSGGMDRRTNQHADVLESLLGAGLDMHLLPLEESGSSLLRDAFVHRNQTHTIYTKKEDSEIAAAAIRNVYRTFRDYDPDGPFIRGARGADTTRSTTEWWANSITKHPLTDDDCDGVKELANHMMHIGISPAGDAQWTANGFISVDPTYDPLKHIITTAIRNALFNHSVALTIVSANAASGSDIKSGGAQPTNLAGHAILLLLDKVRGVLAPIARGIERRDLPTRTDAEGISRYIKTLFPKALMQNLSEGERDILAASLVDPVNARAICEHDAYVIDGTVTTKVTIDTNRDSAMLEKQRARSAESMGHLVAHRVSDVGRDFYVAAVEATLPGVQRNIAPTYVFANMHGRWGKAGAAMQDIRDGQYAMVPLMKDTPEVRSALNTISDYAKARAISPMPSGVITLQPVFASNFNKSMEAVRAFRSTLNGKAKDLCDDTDMSPYVTQEFRLTPRHLIMAPTYVQVTLDSMQRSAVTGDVDIHPLPGIACFQDGSNALNSVSISLACKPV